MGLFTKSFIILALAIATPLVYRQFVDDNSVKYLSSHITNYKVVDQFLRQSANKLDGAAKQYLSKDTATQIHNAIDTHVRPHIEPIVKSIPEYITTLQEKFYELKKIAMPDASKEPAKSNELKKENPSKQNKVEVLKTSTQKADNQATKSHQSYKTVKCSQDKSSTNSEIKLWSRDELAKLKTEEILLAFMGIVYNVTSAGHTYYGPGKEYSVFAGRDATRAYLTGNFTDLSDNISDLDESTYGDLKNWSAFYEKSYPQVGRLEGRYYDSQGCPTAETKRIYQSLDKLGRDSEEDQKASMILPECNSEWNLDTKKSRVWCSKTSGGIERVWTGVPRIQTNEKDNSQRCVCYSKESKVDETLARSLKVYPGCEKEAIECNLIV